MNKYVAAAINREPLAQALRIAARTAPAVFGSLDDDLLADLAQEPPGMPVYFYEPG